MKMYKNNNNVSLAFEAPGVPRPWWLDHQKTIFPNLKAVLICVQLFFFEDKSVFLKWSDN